jgi:hypothetical protein
MYHRTSLRVHKPADVLFAKKWSSESIKHLTFLSLETSCKLYDRGGSYQEVYNFNPSTSFLVNLSPLDYQKHAGDATCKDYFPISSVLDYTPKY